MSKFRGHWCDRLDSKKLAMQAGGPELRSPGPTEKARYGERCLKLHYWGGGHRLTLGLVGQPVYPTKAQSGHKVKPE